MKQKLPVSIIIPTYRREKVLLDTVEFLLALDARASEIILIDQTSDHENTTSERLAKWHVEGLIRWIQRGVPSIPQAMNHALILAKENIVLFLDDDIRPETGLVSAHYAAHQVHTNALIAGRVVQPWEEGIDFSGDTHFHFAGMKPESINEFMGGNFSLCREQAISLGGFDENFVKVAYRFEAEFAHRFIASGKRIYFTPDACLHHLKDASGGTRSFGEHLTTCRPDHAVGAYYFALRTKPNGRWLKDFITRPMRALMTKHHLRRPWWIPTTLIAEFRGMIWAVRLNSQGPHFVKPDVNHA